MSQFWGAMAAVATAIGVGVAFAQLGGWRGLRRKSIREDLELIALLDPEQHAGVRARLQARVGKKLEQYEPDLTTRTRRTSRRVWGAQFAGAAAVVLLVLQFFDIPSTWGQLALGASAGVGVNLLHGLVMSLIQRSEQDEAVLHEARGTVQTVSGISGRASARYQARGAAKAVSSTSGHATARHQAKGTVIVRSSTSGRAGVRRAEDQSEQPGRPESST